MAISGGTVTTYTQTASITYTLEAGAGSLNGTGGAQGTATASSQASAAYAGTKAFNNTSAVGNAWHTAGNASVPQWLKFQFPSGKIISKYRLWNRDTQTNQHPKDWNFQGSNDDSNWTTLDTRTNITNSNFTFISGGTDIANGLNYNEYTFSNSTSYTYYRLYATAHNQNNVVAIGEMALYSGVTSSATDYTVHTFTSSGTLTVAGSHSVDFLLVGGGGGGGSYWGGGGGAGGVVVGTSQTLNAASYSVVVGAGGVTTDWQNEDNGEDSTFNSFVAKGGGAGNGVHVGGQWNGQPGQAGGSGGGGGSSTNHGGGRSGGSGGATNQNTYSGTTNVTGYGNVGGSVTSGSGVTGGGGGGGAGGAGGSKSNQNSGSGAGGNGIQNNFRTGSNVYYGGGGGGCRKFSGGGSYSGGLGGGGTAWAWDLGQDFTVGDSLHDGTANTGGGGAAGRLHTVGAGTGGSGIFVLRYVLPVPGAPTGLTGSITTGQVVLSWTAPSNTGGSAISGYKIEHSTDNSSWSVVEANTGSTAVSYTKTVSYQASIYYRVSAINSSGAGSASATYTGVFTGLPPSPPTNLAVAESSGTVTLSWTAGYSTVTGYKIESSTDNSNWTVNSATTGNTSTSYNVTGLSGSHTVFYFRVSSVASGGTTAAPVLIGNLFLPKKPTSLSATKSGANATLSWTAPTDTGNGSLTSYKIEYSDDNTNWNIVSSSTGNTNTTYSFLGIADGTTYFRVSAISSVAGELSDVANVSASASSYPDAGNIHGWYKAKDYNETTGVWPDSSGAGNDTTSGPNKPTLETDELNSNLKYVQFITNPHTYMSFPDNMLYPNSTNSSYTFLHACRRGKTPLSSSYDNNGRIFQDADRNWLSGFHATRDGGVWYHEGWLNHNSQESEKNWAIHGDIAQKGWFSSYVSGNRKPTSGYYTATGGNGNLDYDKLRINTGKYNAEICDFHIHEMVIWKVQLSDADTVTAMGVLETSVWGSDGSGGDGDTGGAPPKVTGLAASNDYGQSVLTWTAASTATTYKVIYGTNDTNWTIASAAVSGTTHTVTGLTATTQYYFRVAGIGALVMGEFSDSANATTLEPVAPGVPTNLSLTPSGSSVTLSWTAPSNNGSAITGYKIDRSLDNSVWKTVVSSTGSSTASYLHSVGVFGATTYYYKISATNAVGTGTASSVVQTTTTVDTTEFGTFLDVGANTVRHHFLTPHYGNLFFPEIEIQKHLKINERSNSPSVPSDGAGALIYVKTNKKLYVSSNELTEAEIIPGSAFTAHSSAIVTSTSLGIGGNPSNIKKLNVTGTVSTTGTLTVGSNVFPSTDGAANVSLKTNGSGTLSWEHPAGSLTLSTTHTVLLSTNLSSNNQNLKDTARYWCWNTSVDTSDLKYTTGTTQGTNSLFHIKSPGDYTINAVIWVNDATANGNAACYLLVRFYTGQNNNTTRGTVELDYSIGNTFIADDTANYDCGFPGGTVTRYITQAQVNAGIQFEIYSVRMFSQDNTFQNLYANQTLSKIRIEKTVLGLITLGPPSGLSYSGTPFTLSKDNAMATLSPTVTATPTVSSWTVSPSLPNGVSINASTGDITGTPTVNQTAATYTITATNSKGSTTTTISITIEDGFSTSERANLEVEFIANVNASATQWLPAYYSTNNSNLSSNTTNSGDAIATTQWSYSSTNGYIQIGNHGLKVWAYANDGIMSTLDTTAGQAISFEAWIKVGNSSDWGPPSANNPRGWLMTYPTIWGPAITLNDSRVNDAGLGSGGGVGVVPGSATVNDSPPFALGLYGSSTFISNFGSSGTYSQSKNGWDHFVGYYENGGARGIYINGYHVAQDVHTTYPSFDASDGQLIIGNYNTTTSSDHNIKGIAVYGIRMWHKKLDQALVTKLHAAGHNGKVSA